MRKHKRFTKDSISGQCKKVLVEGNNTHEIYLSPVGTSFSREVTPILYYHHDFLIFLTRVRFTQRKFYLIRISLIIATLNLKKKHSNHKHQRDFSPEPMKRADDLEPSVNYNCQLSNIDAMG